MKRILSLIGVVLVVGCGPEGPPDGPFEEYHDNGQLLVKGTVKDGELIVKGSYKDGEPCGEWIMLGETVTQELPC